MRDMGNTKSNSIYNPDERLYPPPVTTGADERDSEISKYIRRKYELGAFKRGASRGLASSNAITSRALARDARSGQSSLDTPSFDGAIKQLPALPISPGRRSTASTGPVWNNLSSQNTGASAASASSSGSAGGRATFSAPTRSMTAPTFSVTPAATSLSAPARAVAPTTNAAAAAAPARPNLLVDVAGSSSSTRPLQLSNFPTVPAWNPQQQPPAATPNFHAATSPMPITSPLALGQQAFFSGSVSPQPSAFAFQQQQQQYGTSPGAPQMGMQMQMPMQMQAQAQAQGAFLQQPMGYMQQPTGYMQQQGMGMGMNGMNGMNAVQMNSGGGMGMQMNGMAMNGGGMMAAPYGQQQYQAYGSY